MRTARCGGRADNEVQMRGLLWQSAQHSTDTGERERERGGWRRDRREEGMHERLPKSVVRSGDEFPKCGYYRPYLNL